jgi:transposase
MWTLEHRAAARRQGLRYASDLTDEEWNLVAPMIPPARRGGRPRDVNIREIINGLLYLLWTGCLAVLLPNLPQSKTIVGGWVRKLTMGPADTRFGRWAFFLMR